MKRLGAECEISVAARAPPHAFVDGTDEARQQIGAEQKLHADQHVRELQGALRRQGQRPGEGDDRIADPRPAEIEQRLLKRDKRARNPYRREKEHDRIGGGQEVAGRKDQRCRNQRHIDVGAILRPIGQCGQHRRRHNAQEHRCRQDDGDLFGMKAFRLQPKRKIGQMRALRHEQCREDQAYAQFETVRLDELLRRKRRQRHESIQLRCISTAATRFDPYHAAKHGGTAWTNRSG